MAREFSDRVTAVTQARSNRKYYAAVVISLPLSSGDAERVVIRVAEATIRLASAVDFTIFTYVAFTGALSRSPTSDEQEEWVGALETAYELGPAAMLEEAGDRLDDLFTSPDYLALNTTNDRYITDLYNAYLGHSPEVGGKDFWMGVLADNDRDIVRDGFRASGDFTGRVSSINNLQQYDGKIDSIGSIGLSDGESAESVDVEITNLDDRYSLYLGQQNRILYPAPAVVMRAYPVGDDEYEADVLITGFARFGDISQRTAPVTIVSDTSRKGLMIGGIESQRCPLIYRGPGCDTNDASPTCSRLLLDAVNGCISKDPAPILIDSADNRPSFGGGPDKAVEAAGATTTDDLGSPDDGWIQNIVHDDPRLRLWGGQKTFHDLPEGGFGSLA